MTEFTDLPIRDDLRGLHPYGAPQIDVPVQLNVNENTFGIPQIVLDDIVRELEQAVREANRYPDREFTALRERLAAYVGSGVGPEQIWAANGSNEIFQQLLQAFGGIGRSMLGFAPTYSMYPLLSAGVGVRWIGVDRQDDWGVSADYAVAAVERERPDLVVLCAPNNPTGTPLGLDVVEAVYEAHRGMLIVDEAYVEFQDTPSAVTLLPGRERLVVSRTMSKAFAFAGVRLGYLVADPAVADALRLVRLPYHLSVLTQAAAVAALRHSAEMLAQVDTIKVQRDRMVRTLTSLGYAPYPTAANFVLLGGVNDPKRTFQGLLDAGVIVRDVGIPHTLRVTAGTEQETTAFLDALAALPND